LKKFIGGTRLIAVSNGKKVKDWAIRSQAPKAVMVRPWGRFRDYKEAGLMELTIPNDGSRYSPALLGNLEVERPFIRCLISIQGSSWCSPHQRVAERDKEHQGTIYGDLS